MGYWLYPRQVSGNDSNLRVREIAPTEENVHTDGRVVERNLWVTQVSSRVGGNGAPIQGVNVLYDKELKELVSNLPLQTWPDSLDWRTQVLSEPVRKPRNERVWFGFWILPGQRARYQIEPQGNLHRKYRDEGTLGPPTPLGSMVEENANLATRIYVEENAQPLQGLWASPTPAQNTETTDPNPTFSGTMPHPAADRALDSTVEVQYLVQEQIGESWSTVAAGSFEPDLAELDNGAWHRRLGLALVGGRTHRVMYRHLDTWGEESPWSDYRTFVMRSGPLPPSIVSPVSNEKIDTLKPASYIGSWGSPLAAGYNSTRIQVYDSRMTRLRYDSGWQVGTFDAVSQRWTVGNTWHGNMVPGTTYAVRAQVRDANLVTSSLSDFQKLRVNGYPTIPRNMVPGLGSVTKSNLLSGVVNDPDDDPEELTVEITAQTLGGANLTGYPKVGIVVDARGRFVHDATALVLGNQYRWRVRAKDALGYGEYSEWHTFTYDTVPDVALLSPVTQDLANLVLQPSAEYAPGVFWTATDIIGQTVTTRVIDNNAWSGKAAWRIVRSAVGTAGGTFIGQNIPVDSTQNHIFYAYFKKESGTSQTHMLLDCYNASNVLVGQVYPNSFAEANGIDVPLGWTRYGGFIGPNAATRNFPAGTTSVRIRIEGSRNSVATVRWDAVWFGPAHVTRSQALASIWFGYADGDYKPRGNKDDWIWLGTPGDAESRGPSILTEPSGLVVTAYSNDAARVKASDRLIVERWTGLAWKQVYDSGYVSGARQDIPFPNLITNYGRWRMRVHMKDSAGKEGISAWAEFLSDFTGPSDLVLEVVSSNSERGEILVRWSPVQQLSDLSFAGYEVFAEEVAGEGVTVAVVRNPLSREYVWRLPKAFTTYNIQVRQVELVNGVEIQGKWSVEQAVVEYRQWMIKTLDDAATPIELRFDMLSEDEPSNAPALQWAEMRSWGEKHPTHFPHAGYAETGSLTVRVLDGDLDMNAKLAGLEALKDHEGAVALMSQIPPDKKFVVFDGIGRKHGDRPNYAVYDLTWRLTGYEEDVRLRETE